jgi:hypothetical protein
MTQTELKAKFESGETLKVFFGTRQSIYSIGGERITYSQFQRILKIYPEEKINNDNLNLGFNAEEKAGVQGQLQEIGCRRLLQRGRRREQGLDGR